MVATALLLALPAAVSGRTRVRQNGNSVTVTSSDSRKDKKGKSQETQTKITTENGDYQFSVSTPEGSNKNYLITGGKVYEIDENGNRREVLGSRQPNGTIVINPNGDNAGNSGNYRVRKSDDGVSVITYDGNVSTRSGASARTATRTRRSQGKYDDPLYDNNGYVEEEAGSSQTMKRVLRNIGDFSGITASRSISVVYTQGKPGEIIIEGPARYVEKIEVTKSNSGMLEIENNYRGNIENSKITVTCSSTSLKSLDFSSASSFISTNAIKVGNDLSIQTSSTSNVTIPTLHCQALSAEGSSASSININNVEASSVSIDLSSACNFNSAQLDCSGTVDVDCSSASNLNIDRLECKQLDAGFSSASTGKIQDITASKVEVGCSSASRFYNRGTMVVNNPAGLADLTCSSTSKMDLGTLRARKVLLGASSQGNISADQVEAEQVGIDVSTGIITLAGQSDSADITAGYMGNVEGRNFNVRNAVVGAARFAKVAIKAANIEYK